MALSVEAFVDFFGNRRYKKIRSKGYIAYKDKHVLSFNLDKEGEVLFGKVMPSQKSGFYNVKIFLAGDNIDKCLCDCANGQALCHHMIALCYHAMKEVSPTDLECKWNRPKEKKTDNVKSIDDMFPPAEHPNVFCKPVSDADISDLIKRITEVSPHCGLAWIAQPEPSADVLDISFLVFQEIICSEPFLKCSDPGAYLISVLSVTKEQIAEIERVTRKQRNDGLWFRVREGRLTGSKVGKVLWHISTRRFPPSFYMTLFGMYSAEGSRSCQHGTSNEEEAIKCYEKEFKCKVEKCGFVLHESGVIGSSPDGKVGDIVNEFKCPISLAKFTTIREAIAAGKGRYLSEDGDGNLQLDLNARLTDHRKQALEYYHQCQCHMLVTGSKMCHLGIWTPTDFRKIDVPWDPAWVQNVQVLLDFYKNKYVPNYFDPQGVRVGKQVQSA